MDKPEEKKKPIDTVGTTQPSDDVVVIGAPTEDGAGANVLRLRQGRIEAGQIRNLEQGKPILGEVVTLRPREGCPNLCDVKVEYAGTAAGPQQNRPSQVATSNYRENWEAIWSRPRDKQLPS